MLQTTLLTGGKILHDNLLKDVFEVLDLDFILKRSNSNPQDIQRFLQAEIPRIFGDDLSNAKMLTPAIKSLTPIGPKGASKKEAKALTGLPRKKVPRKISHTQVDILGQEEATDENEKDYHAAKSALAKAAVAFNRPPDFRYHTIAIYRNEARHKILGSPESAQIINTRLKILELEIQLSLLIYREEGLHLEGGISDIKTQIRQESHNLTQKLQSTKNQGTPTQP